MEVVVKEEGGGEEKAENEKEVEKTELGERERETRFSLCALTGPAGGTVRYNHAVPSSRTSLGESSLPIN